MADAPNELIAYHLHDRRRVPIVPAPVERDWMDTADRHFPYRCLPLNIANQNGWWLLCASDFDLYWYGGNNEKDVEIRFYGQEDNCIMSHFGYGVLTFALPYLFRTPSGVNLWVKGPANYIRDGIQALEGVVETDWSPATFTMNWKVTRPFEWIKFRHGEPFCHLVPVPRGLTESMSPVVRQVASNPALKQQYETWEAGRAGFLKGLKAHDPETVARGWQKDYFQGKTQDGQRVEAHQTRLALKEFKDETGT